LLLTVSIHFAQNLTWDWRHLLLAAAAFVALRAKAKILWVVVIAAGLSLLRVVTASASAVTPTR
jgi:hypothetical protein